MDLIRPILAKINDFTEQAANATEKDFSDFINTLQDHSQELRKTGTKLARKIANHEGGCKSDASATLHSATALLKSSFEELKGEAEKSEAIKNGSIRNRFDRSLETLKNSAGKLVENFVNFFKSPEAILKAKSGLSPSAVDELLTELA